MKERRFYTYSLKSEGKRAPAKRVYVWTREADDEDTGFFFPRKLQTPADVTEMKNRLAASCRPRELPTLAGKRFTLTSPTFLRLYVARSPIQCMVLRPILPNINIKTATWKLISVDFREKKKNCLCKILYETREICQILSQVKFSAKCGVRDF